MSDFMRWMYDHYIKPNIDNQPKDESEAMQLDLLHNELDDNLQKTLQSVLRAYTVRGFCLGLRTGVGLKDNLG